MNVSEGEGEHEGDTVGDSVRAIQTGDLYYVFRKLMIIQIQRLRSRR